jgi:hypothetical protein
MNLVSGKNTMAPSLMDLQAMRNEVKRQKQMSCDMRIPTDNHRFRYQEFFEERTSNFMGNQSKKFKHNS